MRFQPIILSFLLLVLFLGCAPQKKDKDRNLALDLSWHNAAIVRDREAAALLDSDLATGKEPATPKKNPPKKDFTSTEGGANQFLSALRDPEERIFAAGTEGEAGEEEGILLNFDNADLYEVIQVVAEVLDLNYLIDPQIKGVVNIRSGKKIAKNELFAVFRKILNINGLDIRREGDFDVIYVAKKLTSRVIYDPEDIGKLDSSARMIIQVVPILHLSSAEAQKLIEPYLTNQGTTYNLDSQNMLIITDYESKILEALTILSRLDISPLANLKVRLARIDQAPLFELRDDLTEVLGALKINKKDYEGVTIVALERVNSLLLISNNDFLLDTAEEWIKELDIAAEEQAGSNIYVYNVRNSVASELADLIGKLIEEDKKQAAASHTAPKPTSTTGKNDAKQPAATKKKITTRGDEGGPTLTADDSRNIILIRALQADYNRLLKLLERLDNLPRQVMIEVMVAEIILDDSWEFGLEWAIKNNRLQINDNSYDDFYSTSFGVPTGVGFSWLMTPEGKADDIVGLLNTIADDNRFSLLSSPQVMVLNNETATVNVGSQVPIVTSETISDNTTTSATRTIQYKDTGIILTVTPRINSNGIIILEIDQQVSEATENKTSGITSPIITSRQMKTKLAVKDAQSILLGGLIEKKDNNNESGIPWFKDIPYLGWLFKYRTENSRRTELLVMITPYVIESENVLDQYIKSFQGKINVLRHELYNEPPPDSNSEVNNAPISD